MHETRVLEAEGSGRLFFLCATIVNWLQVLYYWVKPIVEEVAGDVQGGQVVEFVGKTDVENPHLLLHLSASCIVASAPIIALATGAQV